MLTYCAKLSFSNPAGNGSNSRLHVQISPGAVLTFSFGQCSRVRILQRNHSKVDDFYIDYQ